MSISQSPLVFDTKGSPLNCINFVMLLPVPVSLAVGSGDPAGQKYFESAIKIEERLYTSISSKTLHHALALQYTQRAAAPG